MNKTKLQKNISLRLLKNQDVKLHFKLNWKELTALALSAGSNQPSNMYEVEAIEDSKAPEKFRINGARVPATLELTDDFKVKIIFRASGYLLNKLMLNAGKIPSGVFKFSIKRQLAKKV